MGAVGTWRGPSRLCCGEMVWQTRGATGGQSRVGSHASTARFVCGYRFSDTAIERRELRLQAPRRSSEEQVLFTICELSRKIRDREISPVELTHHCLVLIEKLNPALNAYITVTAASARERARLAEPKKSRPRNLSGRTHAPLPRAHRKAQPSAQRLHHGDSRIGS